MKVFALLVVVGVAFLGTCSALLVSPIVPSILPIISDVPLYPPIPIGELSQSLAIQVDLAVRYQIIPFKYRNIIRIAYNYAQELLNAIIKAIEVYRSNIDPNPLNYANQLAVSDKMIL